jgi:internalin A
MSSYTFDTPEEAYVEAERLIEAARRRNYIILDLSSLGLVTLPESIGQLSQLQTLYAYNNRLTTLPDSIGQLSQLQKLYASHNQLHALPDSIGQLSQLQTLYAYNNRLATLPDSIGQLSQLQELDVSHNQLRVLPDSIGQLSQLQKLGVADIQLRALPDSIGQLSQLQKLDVSHNQLRALPASIGQLSQQLQGLFLHSNEALHIPSVVLGPTLFEVLHKDKQPADPQEILRYYFAQRAAGRARALNEAKVLFIGESEVGKSSLITALKEGPKERHFAKTRGIVRERWWPEGERKGVLRDLFFQLRAFKCKPEGERKGALRLNLWDFGGQEVYHATHTFFLTERAIYVVVVDARANEGQNNIEYWLQMARSFGGGAPVIVAVNKCDQHGDGPDENLLRRKYGDLQLQFIRTSCWTGQGLDTLEAAILTHSKAMPEVQREMPIAWLRIKDELEKMTAETLPLSAYEALCEKHGEPERENQKLLLELWHKLGTVLYFCDNEGVPMSDRGILNPEWVTKGVYAVLDDENLQNRFGLMSRRQLSDTLSAADYGDRSPQFIEEMMRRFELLYDAPDHHRRTMLVPRLLNDKEPKLDWPATGTIRFLYRYEVLPAGLLPRFIVRRHQNLSENPGPWRYGCVLELEGCRVLVRADKEKKEVEIVVSGPAAQRREALDKVRLTFDDIHNQIKDLPVEEFIPVPGHPDAPLLPYALLRDLEWNAIDTHNAQSAERGKIIKVDVSEALGSVRTKARKEREAQQTGTYVAGDYVKGNKMSDGRSIQIGGNANGHINQGDDAAVGEKIIKGDNNDQRIMQLSQNPAELKVEIEKLHGLIDQARAAGANKYVCDAAETNVRQLEEATNEPESDESKEKAGGALAMLKNAAEGFKSYAEIGENFEKVLKLVSPALAMLLKTQLPL